MAFLAALLPVAVRTALRSLKRPTEPFGTAELLQLEAGHKCRQMLNTADPPASTIMIMIIMIIMIIIMVMVMMMLLLMMMIA
jgi:hypothetical protein